MEGARVVIFEGEPLELSEETTYSIGIMRAGEWQEPHVGSLVEKVLFYGDKILTNLYEELESWFKHPAGFFVGRGTAKAPVFKAIEIDLQYLARLIDQVWER